MRAVPRRSVEVRYHVRKGWFLWHGHIVYRVLADERVPFGTFWLEWQKKDGAGATYPLCRARKRAGLMAKLRRHAASLGNVVREQEVA